MCGHDPEIGGHDGPKYAVWVCAINGGLGVRDHLGVVGPANSVRAELVEAFAGTSTSSVRTEVWVRISAIVTGHFG
jgi:hypothetical protein